MSADDDFRVLSRRRLLQGFAATPLIGLLPGCSVSESGYSAGAAAGSSDSNTASTDSTTSPSSGTAASSGNPSGTTAGSSSSNNSSNTTGSSGNTSDTNGSGANSPTSSAVFVHPGLLHTASDFDRMAQNVAAGEKPWIDGWKILIANWHSSLTYTPRPQAIVSRGNDGVHPDNSRILFNDVAAAYACALRWKISGDSRYADKSIQIMNGWAYTLTQLAATCGCDRDHDGILMAGLQGYQFANAGEIMRTYTGWAANDFAAFQGMMKNLFYPVNVGSYLHSHLSSYSNWDLCCVASAMAIGVLCDEPAMFQSAVDYFKTGFGNGCIRQTVYWLHPGYLGQTQESGRDQGHDTLSIGLAAVICEQAWNQGIDLYGYDNNRFLAGAEYVAKGNLIESGSTYYPVPFAPYTNGGATFTQFSTGSIGAGRPIWASIYNHYVNRKGIAAPYSEKFAKLMQPDGGGGNFGPNSGGYDQLGYGTLAFTRDPIPSGAAPSGLTAFTASGDVTLSWWGTTYATSYEVKRSTSSGGPYTTVASGITDLLTYSDTGLAAGNYYYVITAMTPLGGTAASNEAHAVVGTALHTWLKFDDRAVDSSGNAHDATLSQGAVFAPGKKGSAVSLNGTAGCYVSLPTGFLSGVADFTLAFWVYLNSAQTWARLIDFGTGTDQYMYLTPRANRGGVRFTMSLNSAPGEESIEGPNPLPTRQWLHVAVTLSGSTATLYVDGVVAGTNNSMLYAPFRLGNTDKNYIGRSQFAADPYLDGLIDDFRIYWGALTSEEIAALVTS